MTNSLNKMRKTIIKLSWQKVSKNQEIMKKKAIKRKIIKNKEILEIVIEVKSSKLINKRMIKIERAKNIGHQTDRNKDLNL